MARLSMVWAGSTWSDWGVSAGLAGLSQAAKWYERPAEQGFAAAQFMMGFLYEHGKGVRRVYARALDHYRSAADQGHATAANNLAALYLHHWASECGAFESSV